MRREVDESGNSVLISNAAGSGRRMPAIGSRVRDFVPRAATAVIASVLLALQPLMAQPLMAQPLMAQPLMAQPSAAQFPVAQPLTVDHQPFDSLLQQHVVRGFVDYDAIGRAPAFARYLTSLDRARLDDLDEDARLAFWLNVYNAYTIQLVVAHRETTSIRNINKSLGLLRLKGPWSEPLVRAAGRRLSLDEVFHDILRKQFGEPRIHFAVACGAVGCAPLRSEAYTGAALVDQLNDQARVFLRDSTKNRIERNRAMLSPVLMVHRGDFGATRQELERFIAPWFDGAERERLTKGTYLLVSGEFDWSLNSQANGRSRGLM